MNLRIKILFFLFFLSCMSIHAQWTKQDSLNLEKILSGNEEIKLNPEAIKNIQLEVPDIKTPDLFEPLLSTDESLFKFDETLPTFFTDSLDTKKIKYMSLKPFNIHTKYNEDPIYGSTTDGYIWPMATKNYSRPPKANEKTIQPDFLLGKKGGYTGSSTTVYFSMEDLLQNIFSKKGRTKLRNAKKANAWKTY